MKMKTLLHLLIALLALPAMAAPHYVLRAPTSTLQLSVSLDGDSLTYGLTYAAAPLLSHSTAAITLVDGTTLGHGIKRHKARRSTISHDLATPFYRKSRVQERCNVLTIDCGTAYSIEFRLYDHAMAYRFVTHRPDSLTVMADRNAFRLAGADSITYMPAGYNSSFEDLYSTAPLARLDTATLMASQLLVHHRSGVKLLLTDYNVRDYPVMLLCASASHDALLSAFAPVPSVVEPSGSQLTRMRVVSRWPYIARVAGSRTLPWRTVIVAPTDAHLLSTDVPACLADPCAMPDVSWIRPGKTAWEWWNACNLTGVDFATGVNDSTYRYYIDFAARSGLQYVLLDAGWTAPQVPLDLLRTIPQVNIPQLVSYAAERGVGIILWADMLPLMADAEHIVSTYAAMGVRGFKIDHMNRSDQLMVRAVEQISQLCARHHMLVDYHGVFPPTGLHFTWPNVVNYEAVKGLEAAKWAKPDAYDAVTHECRVPFIRQVVGPIDYTQGAMRNATRRSYYPCSSQPMSQGTRCRQLAEYVLFEGAFSMLCDSPTAYEAQPQCTRFLGQVPTVWTETRILQATFGQSIVQARRSGREWYLAGITNWTARSVSIDVSWLAGRTLQVWHDGVNAHRNAEDFRLDTVAITPVTPGTTAQTASAQSGTTAYVSPQTPAATQSGAKFVPVRLPGLELTADGHLIVHMAPGGAFAAHTP